MAKNLVIVESPAKSKTISKILGKDYAVMASMGHVCDLPKSKIGIDLEDGFEMEIVPSKGKEKVIADLRKAAKSSDKVYLCSDADREGEAISYYLSEILNVPHSKITRATFNEITPKAILAAIANPRGIDMKMVDAQKARRALDRIVGYKLSPLLWKKIMMGLSAGRVQSVATRLLVEREKEIMAFKPEEYWTITGLFDDGIKAELRELSMGHAPLAANKKVVCSADDLEKSKNRDDYILLDKGNTDGLASSLRKRNGKVSSYETKETRSSPLPPFSTSILQQSAANRLGFDAKRTMGVAQGLYEAGLITYMRTDSFNISKDALQECRSLVLHMGDQYLPEKPNYYKSKKGAQEAHECIRPTHVEKEPGDVSLPPDQAKVYDLIWRRFVSSQMTPAVYDSSSCDIRIEDDDEAAMFRATGRRMKFDGWTKVYGNPEKDEPLPMLVDGQSVKTSSITPAQHFTQPPARYNEASLVKTMEQEGIGRPSTYASTISVIQERNYVQKMGRGGKAPLRATDLGIAVTDSLVGHFPSVMDVGFTREMEEDLDRIEGGDATYAGILGKFYKAFAAELKKAEKDMPSTKGGKETKHPCPKCSQMLVARLSKFGAYLQCPNEDCKHKMDIGEGGKPVEKEGAKPTGIKCDKCGSDVFHANGRFGPYLHCEKYKKGCDFTMSINKGGEARRKFQAIPTDEKCDKCQKPMVIRVSNRGKKIKPFLSCTGFPKCRNAKDVPECLKAKGDQALVTFHEMRKKDEHDKEAMKSFLDSMEE